MSTWHIYKGERKTRSLTPSDMPEAPPWRRFKGEVIASREITTDERTVQRGETFRPGQKEIEMVNTALHLRRPLLVTGKPGTGKSSLACSVAWELGLGSVLYWPITTRTTLRDGLYQYDAVGRLQELQMERHRKELGDVSETRAREKFAPETIGRYIRLGPLGTALLPSEIPRVLLIDEIDKSDIDLPNDLLNIFEEGAFEIPELSRLADVCSDIEVQPHDAAHTKDRVSVRHGMVQCLEFPIIFLTSNAERELPPPFLRRCLRLEIPEPDDEKLAAIVQAHFGDAEQSAMDKRQELIAKFLEHRSEGTLATDQLLNAIYLSTRNIDLEAGDADDRQNLLNTIYRHLDKTDML